MIQSRAVPQIPVAAREDRRMEWLTVEGCREIEENVIMLVLVMMLVQDSNT